MFIIYYYSDEDKKLVSYKGSAVSCQRSAAFYKLSVVNYQLKAISYQRSATSYKLPAVNYQLTADS